MKYQIYSISEENDEESSNTDLNDFAFGRYDRLGSDEKINEPRNKIFEYQGRMLRKNGTCNMYKLRLNNNRKKLSIHFQDLFTSLVEMRWRWIFLTFSLLNVLTFYIFGAFWWIIAYHHGDLKSPTEQNGYNDVEPCINGLNDFGTGVLFSIEVQTTLGFGSRFPTSNCPEAVFTLLVQIIFGTLLNGILLGLIFTKAARPMARRKAIIFSKKAVICMRDNTLCLLVRVADVRKSKILGANFKAYVFGDHITQEGEVIRRYQRKLEISVDEAGSEVILWWPLTICHKINAKSPLYDMSALDILHSDLEIAVCLSGVMETTGQTLEATTSYLPNEILWGHRFAPMVHKTSNRRGYIVDYNKFETVIPIDTPICSARQISEFSDPNSPIPAFFFGQSFENRKLESTSSIFNKGFELLNE